MGKSPALRAVAVDANSFGGGRLNISVLENWAQMLQSVGLEVWIPEPVAWELAEHAVEEFASAQSRLRASGKILSNAGLEVPNWPAVSRDKVIEQCMTAIEQAHANVRLLELSPQDGKDALLDQILLRPPAVRKMGTDKHKGVKTGAADIASVRLLHRYGDTHGAYAILTEDRDWVQVYEANDWPVPEHYKDWRTLKDHLFTSVSAAGAVPAVLSFLRGGFLGEAAAKLEPLMGSGLGSYGEVDDLGPFVRSYEVEHVNEVAGIAHLESYEETSELVATVLFLADLGVTQQRYDPSDTSWSSDYFSYSDALLRASIVFQVADDIVVAASVGAEEPTRVVGTFAHWEPEDAFEAALDALRAVPGLGDLDWPGAHDAQPAPLTAELVGGRSVVLRLSASVLGEWELEVLVEEETEGILRCSQDQSAWVGGNEGYFVAPPWELSLDGDDVGHPEWHLSARLLHRVSAST